MDSNHSIDQITNHIEINSEFGTQMTVSLDSSYGFNFCNGFNFVYLHKLAGRSKFIFLFRHTIEATQVAIVGQGYPQIVVYPVESIYYHTAFLSLFNNRS